MHIPPLRRTVIFFQAIVVTGIVALVPATAGAAIFTASESGCGPNSIWQAIQDANANPGVDTIEILAGASFGQDSMKCGGPRVLGDQFIGTFTDSAVVKGNGARVVAQNTWITTGGILIPSQRRDCPVNGDAMISEAGSVFEIGTFGADNSGITVTVDEFHALGPGGLFAVRSGAELEVSNSRYENIWNAWGESDCDTHAIKIEANATFTARNSQIIDTFSTLNGIHFDSTPAASTISAFGAGATINLDRVRIEQGLAGYAVSNIGGTTNIVSSIFDASGGFHNGPGSTMSIVNTAWSGRFGAFAGQTDQVHNQGTMRIQASTFWVPDTQNCESGSPNPPNVCPSHAAPLLNDGGSMELKGTAVGTDVSQVDPSGNSTPVTGSEVVNGGDTWIGPSRDPSAGFAYPGTAEWINLFVEPDPDTGSPGLDGIMPVINVLGDGVLIDRIDCSADPLINPIDNTAIDIDVLGNPRCDGSGRRNIGAVQTQTAPHLVVNRIGDGLVDLVWAAPANCPDLEAIGGYNIYRRLVGGSFGAPVVIDGAGTLSYSDTSVTNGEQYEYAIKARCGFVDAGGGFTDISESAASNLAAATPIGPIGTPVPTATPGDGQVDLTWTIPDLGGRTLLNYFITYFPVGTTDYGFEATLTPAVTITGLTNGTDYQFMVFAITTSNESSDAGLATAIPVEAVLSSALFRVTKTFSDGSTDQVRVTLNCSTGLPLSQSATIGGGDQTGVTFVVTNIPGPVECEVTETGSPAGYTPVFNGGAGCLWNPVVSGVNSCVIVNQAQDATFTANVVWNVIREGGNPVETHNPVTITCDQDITSASSGNISNDMRTATAVLGDGGFLTITVDTSGGAAACSAAQSIAESAVETESDCQVRLLEAGSSDSCTFVNTVFFEGIPMLGDRGLAILVLLMLGMGVVGVRRFV